jgi:membrane associated rhomboid family serine protease
MEEGIGGPDTEWKRERKKLFLSMLIPFLFVAVIWLVKIAEVLLRLDFSSLGIYPLHFSGLIGIVTSPFIHSDFNHLFNNTLPLFVLGTALFYFYSQVAFRVSFWIILLTGLTVWIFGREAYHIGASGIIYGFAAFLFFSGIIRMHIPLIGLSLLVVFIYGEMVWGAFPGLKVNISWESHMLGAVSGIFLAIWYRKEGPQRPVIFPEEDEEEDEKTDENQENQDSPEKLSN